MPMSHHCCICDRTRRIQVFFFFQAEDGIRDGRVTGVQTCALPILAEAPPTIDAALEAAYHSAAIYFTFTDLIVADPYKDMEEGLTLAYYIGQSRVVGATTT